MNQWIGGVGSDGITIRDAKNDGARFTVEAGLVSRDQSSDVRLARLTT